MSDETESTGVERLEDVLKFLIMFGVIAAALAASFTHMHDWTVRALTHAVDVPASSVSWYGWSNATISELVPLAGFLSVRRRLASGMPIWSYPTWLASTGAALSIFSQLAWVSDGVAGGIAAAFLAILPALASIAITKLVMSDLDVARKRRADAATRAAERKAAEDRTAERIRKAEAATADMLAKAEAAHEAEAEARDRAEAAEAGRVQAEAEAETLRSAAARAEAEAAAVIRRAEQDAAKLRSELADRRSSATTRAPRVLKVDIPDDLPAVDGVSVELVARIVEALRHLGHERVSQAAIAQAAGTSDRTVRKVMQALTSTPAAA